MPAGIDGPLERDICQKDSSKGATVTNSQISPGFWARFFAPEIRAFRGQGDLATVFWGYGVLVSIGLGLLLGGAMVSGDLLLEQALVLLAAAYTGWIVTAIWRNSENADLPLATLARWLTVAWALNSGFVLLFVQMDLLLAWIGGR